MAKKLDDAECRFKDTTGQMNTGQLINCRRQESDEDIQTDAQFGDEIQAIAHGFKDTEETATRSYSPEVTTQSIQASQNQNASQYRSNERLCIGNSNQATCGCHCEPDSSFVMVPSVAELPLVSSQGRLVTGSSNCSAVNHHYPECSSFVHVSAADIEVSECSKPSGNEASEPMGSVHKLVLPNSSPTISKVYKDSVDVHKHLHQHGHEPVNSSEEEDLNSYVIFD